ncbi:UNVERIFIED_CONTAM: hypothetical protein Sradi_5626000 [Sesamum radiatum]|uniref:ABC1 family protein n=1 Tax=Sesamum radiatum TaxID=300843 RepID=A0AAW2L0E1_SESRA
MPLFIPQRSRPFRRRPSFWAFFHSVIQFLLNIQFARKLIQMGWGNIYKRRVKVFTLAILIYIDYKVLQHREKWTKNSKRADLWDKAHERNAKRVLKLIVQLEGLWVKLGQYLSTRADVLPPAYIRLLKQLQDSLPPRPLKEIAQVHRATLADGQEVVVKVQHEGIKEIILEDLKNAKSVVDWIAWAEPQYDFNPMIDEWCKEAPKELDFNHEAENTRKVSRNLGCKSNGDDNNINRVDVLIPEVITSTEKVLILEYMDGVRLNDSESLQALGVDKQKLVEEITRAYAHQIYVDGFFNGDPHPGNFLVSKAPPHRPILLDFGLTKKLSFPMKQALAKMFLASAEQTMKSFAERRTKNLKVLQEKMKLNEKEVKRFNPVDAFPGDIIIFSRVINLLRGLSSTMDVRIVYVDIMRPFAESVLQCNVNRGPAFNANWIHDTPVLSDVEDKLRKLLIELGNTDKVLGIQVHHVLNHTSGLHNALASLTRENPLLMTDWDACLNFITEMVPETEPGREQLYHYLSFGWLCGGIIEHASRKKFQEILEEAFVRPLNIDGELYIGIPPGVESRLATLTSDLDDIKKLSEPPLGSHPHIPEFPSLKPTKKRKGSKHAHNTDSSNSTNSSREDSGKTYSGIPTDDSNCNGTISVAIDGFGNDRKTVKLYSNSKIHDAFMGVGEYENLTLPGGQFGLGFKRSYSEDGNLVGFGHSGMGGSTGYCDINHRFAIAVTLNKMNFGGVTAKVIELVCSELNIPLPADFYRFKERINDNESNVVGPLIN